jgi:3-oxoacyl-[acyl-carrier protein] reductase
MTVDLSGKTALVTGGAIGIGRGIALRLAQAGADIALTHRSHDGDAVAAEIRQLGRKADSYPLDATNDADVEHVIGRAVDSLGGRIDILINNAGGLLARVPLAEMSSEHWHNVINLNLTSAFACTRAVLPHMPDGGRIVNISSLAAHTGGGPGSGAYAAAKAGMNGLTRGLAKELGPRGITVNAIAPGTILDTPFHETFTPKAAQEASIAATPLLRAGVPDDVAGAVLYLASELGAFCTGAVLDLNGGSYFH